MRIHVTRYTQLVICKTLLNIRYMFCTVSQTIYVIRFMIYVIRYTLYVKRYTICSMQ